MSMSWSNNSNHRSYLSLMDFACRTAIWRMKKGKRKEKKMRKKHGLEKIADIQRKSSWDRMTSKSINAFRYDWCEMVHGISQFKFKISWHGTARHGRYSHFDLIELLLNWLCSIYWKIRKKRFAYKIILFRFLFFIPYTNYSLLFEWALLENGLFTCNQMSMKKYYCCYNSCIPL